MLLHRSQSCRKVHSILVGTRSYYASSVKMASTSGQGSPNADSGKVNFPTDASLPGEYFEIRQTHPTGDYKPDPSKSLGLSPARQALLDDIIALYEMKPTVERVRRYTPDCVYNDQFVYANDRYKMAAQWFALPKLFAGAKSHGYQVVTNDRDLIQFRHEEVSDEPVALFGLDRILMVTPPPSPLTGVDV